MITKENLYKYKDKKMLKAWSKGELINFIFQLINTIEEEPEKEKECENQSEDALKLACELLAKKDKETGYDAKGQL